MKKTVFKISITATFIKHIKIVLVHNKPIFTALKTLHLNNSLLYFDINI